MTLGDAKRRKLPLPQYGRGRTAHRNPRPEVRGAEDVAEIFSSGAKPARLALVDSSPGMAWLAGKQPRVIFDFTSTDNLVSSIDLLADDETLHQIELTIPMP